jgi:hypothetical protein
MVKFRRSPPPLSSGPGRGPLKAETRVRTSLGAPTAPAISGGFLLLRPSHPHGGDPRPKHEFEPRWGHQQHPLFQAGFYCSGPLIPMEGTRGRNTSSNLVGGTNSTRYFRRVFIAPALSSPWRGPKAETRVRTWLGAPTAPAISGGFLLLWRSHPHGGDPRPKHEFEPGWGHQQHPLFQAGFYSPALSSPWREPEAETRVRTWLGAPIKNRQYGDFMIPGPSYLRSINSSLRKVIHNLLDQVEVHHNSYTGS